MCMLYLAVISIGCKFVNFITSVLFFLSENCMIELFHIFIIKCLALICQVSILFLIIKLFTLIPFIPDFIEQYPDCFHLTAARKIFENYDHINSIVPSSDINCRRGKSFRALLNHWKKKIS